MPSLPLIQYLKKRRYGNRGGGAKYFIDCPAFQNYPESIQTEMILKNVDKQNVAILTAFAQDDEFRKKIVIKLTYANEIDGNREYRIGEILYEHKISGFIWYLCTFPCFDDTISRAPKSRNGEKIKPKAYTDPICQAPHLKKYAQNVLVMPYIQEGSLESYTFTPENIFLLKSTLIHAIMSLTVAYDQLQFIHGDLHLGNILLKKTTKQDITYHIRGIEPITLDTMGYKVILMDFEKSKLILDVSEKMQINVGHFWKDLLFLIKKTGVAFDNYDDYYITWDDADILSFIHRASQSALPCSEIMTLIHLVNESTFYFLPTSKITYSSI